MTTKTKTAVAAMQEIEENATRHEAEPRFVRVMPPYPDHIRQGDVLVVLAPDSVKSGKPRGTNQVAIGTTTGSHHVATGAVTVLERVQPGVLDGPIVEASERWVLTHPEHAHVSFPPGRYAAHYQRDLDTERAVQD